MDLKKQDHLMCFQLLAILTGQGDISEVLVFSQVSKDNFNILMEAIPVVGYWSLQPKGTTKMHVCNLIDYLLNIKLCLYVI